MLQLRFKVRLDNNRSMAWRYRKIEKGDSNSQGHRFGVEIDPAFRGGMFRRKIEPEPALSGRQTDIPKDDKAKKKDATNEKGCDQGK